MQLPHKLLISESFPQAVVWTKIQQCKQRQDESWIMRFESFQTLFWMFSNSQNDPLLNSTVLGVNEELAALNKKHNLGWSALHKMPLCWLTNFSKLLRERNTSIKIVNLRLYQLNNQSQAAVNKPPFSPRLTKEPRTCFYCGFKKKVIGEGTVGRWRKILKQTRSQSRIQS